MTAKLHVLNVAKDRAFLAKIRLFNDARAMVSEAGDDLAGYAIVTVTRDGGVTVAKWLADVNVPPGLVPTFVAQALERDTTIRASASRTLDMLDIDTDDSS